MSLKSNNDSIAATEVADTNDVAEQECARLREFKHFLREQVVVNGGVTSAGIGGGEVKQCMTRNNNETYPVSAEELQAELLLIGWTQLQLKRCPRHFQLGLMRAVIADVERECRITTACDLTSTADKQPLTAVEPLETQFDLLKLQKCVLNSLGKLLTRLNDNAETGNLQHYADPGSICSSSVHCNCPVVPPLATPTHVSGHIKNKPRKMEDRHICLESFSELYQLKQNYSFYGVFDGHSGALAASYAANQLPYLLAEQLKEASSSLSVSSYRDAFETAFLKADAMFVQKQISSGTTAVCALISKQVDVNTQLPTPSHLYVAWVGDSRALLVGATASLQLVKSHKPDTPDERKRVEQCDGGGAVMFIQGQWRVNGILNVSRSIGDYSVNAVIAEPDFVDVKLTNANDYLVLGTDGLWDHVDEATIVKTIYLALADTERKLEDIPKLLIELAKQGDSQDNITVVIVLLKERAKISENYKNT